MKDLLNTYSLEEIILFIFLFAVAVKECINLIDWAKERIYKKFNEDQEVETTAKDLSKQIEDLSDDVRDLHDSVKQNQTEQQGMKDQIALLMESDKDDIKSWITKEHHYWVYEKGFIDDYSLDCLEKRFKHYQAEGGNSFVADLMKEIRELPKVSVSHTINDIKNNK